MYRIRITSHATKSLKKLKRNNQEEVAAALEDLKIDPLIGKPLEFDLTGKYSIRIGTSRVVYKIHKKDQVVEIHRVEHRSIVYLPLKK